MTPNLVIARPMRVATITSCILSAWVAFWAIFVPFGGIPFVLFGILSSTIFAFLVIGILLCGRPILVFSIMAASTLWAAVSIRAMLVFAHDLDSASVFVMIAGIPVYVSLAIGLLAATFGWVKHFRKPAGQEGIGYDKA